MREAGIRIEGLRKRYGEGDTAVDALKDVNMVVAPGEVVGLIGPSGSGKSTLLKCLGAVIEPTAGRMILGGQTIYDNGWKIPDLRALRRDSIGFVFQAPYLIPFLDVTDNVALLPMLAGRPNAEARERALELLVALDVGHRAKAQPSELSGGEQQRVSIARALANRPPVILADEPTAPLDSERALSVRAHPQPDGHAVPHGHHRGDPRRKDHPDLQADLSHPGWSDRGRGGTRLEPLTRSNEIQSGVVS
jgi:putative ABC transport system ATP-binding protein